MKTKPLERLLEKTKGQGHLCAAKFKVFAPGTRWGQDHDLGHMKLMPHHFGMSEEAAASASRGATPPGAA